MEEERVLVTGGSGFVGSHCVFALLNAGYLVRTTVRSAEREADVRNMVARAGAKPGDNLTFAVADLTSDAGWPEAIDGSAFVLHVASPYPPDEPAHEDEVIVPARNGTLRVLRAARDAVARFVIATCSSICGRQSPRVRRIITAHSDVLEHVKRKVCRTRGVGLCQKRSRPD